MAILYILISVMVFVLGLAVSVFGFCYIVNFLVYMGEKRRK